MIRSSCILRADKLLVCFTLLFLGSCARIEPGNPLWTEFFLLNLLPENQATSYHSLYVATNAGLSISQNTGDSWDTRTSTNAALSGNALNAVSNDGSTILAGSNGNGLSISVNGGTSFSTKTTVNGIGDNVVNAVWSKGSMFYVGTDDGLAISSNAGSSFTNYSTSAGMGNWGGFGIIPVLGFSVQGNTIYVATLKGFATSTDGGITYTNTLAGSSGLGDNESYDVFVDASKVYVATKVGLSISTDGLVGHTFTTRTVANSGLAHNVVNAVFVSGFTVFAGTNGGLSVSKDGGSTFTTKTSLPVYDLFVIGNNVYMATQGGGLAVSFDSGNTFTNLTTTEGLAHNTCNGIVALAQ